MFYMSTFSLLDFNSSIQCKNSSTLIVSAFEQRSGVLAYHHSYTSASMSGVSPSSMYTLSAFVVPFFMASISNHFFSSESLSQKLLNTSHIPLVNSDFHLYGDFFRVAMILSDKYFFNLSFIIIISPTLSCHLSADIVSSLSTIRIHASLCTTSSHFLLCILHLQ